MTWKSCRSITKLSESFWFADELQEKTLMENHAKKTLFEIFPERFNKTDYEKTSLEHIVVILKECYYDLKKNETSKISERTKHMHTHSHAPEKLHHVHPRTRKRRAAGGNHQHSFHDKEKSINHHILHELTHAFHLGSMVILTVLLVEVKKNPISLLHSIPHHNFYSHLQHKHWYLVTIWSQCVTLR